MPSRRSSPLYVTLERNLSTYAAAAGAAGVTLLALGQPAEGRIVYTKTHVILTYPSHYDLDLNHDGTTDFFVNNYWRLHTTHYTYYNTYLLAIVGPSGGAEVPPDHVNLVRAIKPGKSIGPQKSFVPAPNQAFMVGIPYRGSSPIGSWVNVKNRYAGLRFSIHGHTHYGWARFNVEVDGKRITGHLNGYAYETNPNKPITAGDEGTGAGLGHLALGVAGRQAVTTRKQ